MVFSLLAASCCGYTENPLIPTVQISGTTSPNLIYDLRAKLDGTGRYDDFEVERVVKVELDPKSTQGDLVAAITPVAERLLSAYKAAQAALKSALAREDATLGGMEDVSFASPA